MNPPGTYPIPKLEDLPADIRDKMLEVQKKAGFIPNVFVTLAHRPDEFRAFFAYHDALMLKPSGLSKAEKEMIVVATSGLSHCPYCVIAHGAILRIHARNPQIADQVAVHHGRADLTQRQKAMLDFACKLSRTPEAVAQADHETLRGHGFSAEDIWDIGGITAFFALSNRMAHLIDMRPNDEFYLMGRVPPPPK
ncbi:MAG TPA: peroxidase-related enzyme [Burkholderiales bacterium]|nr:peroxidase-related enzyme [Burkholderiales bacterium]